MKYMFASDLHGSAFYTQKVLEEFERSGAEKLILLGDLLYHGARNDLTKDYNTKKCTALLNQYADRIIACRGNCDSEIDQMVLNFPMSSDYNILELNGFTFFMTHGHLFDPEHLPPMGACDVFAFGHIHIPVIQELDNDITIVNPGSASLPKNGYPESYAILDGNHFIIRDFDGGIIKEIRLAKTL